MLLALTQGLWLVVVGFGTEQWFWFPVIGIRKKAFNLSQAPLFNIGWWLGYIKQSHSRGWWKVYMGFGTYHGDVQ